MKRAKKGLAALLPICMLVTFLPASALAIGPEVGAEGLDEEAVAPVEEETEPVGEPAEPDNGAYSALKQAIEAASDGKETTVTLAGDIAGMTTEQIITIPENKNIILDMEGHSITVASDFTGRPIVNKGTLTVTGNGTIDASASKTGGYGAIDNYGTLTIENGTYTGSVDASGASIKNRPDSVLKIQDGTFNGAMTAVYNAGKTYIYDGTFDCRSCSSCNSSSWGYTIQSHQDSEESAKPELYFYNGTVIGVQGAFSTSAGYSEVRDGEFKTVACDKHSNGSSAFYALYVAGESGEVECNVYGGEFTSISKVAAFVGNSNDGGDKKEALVHIYGGSFISQSDDKEAVHVDEALGGLEIAGGTFSSDVSEYVVEGTEITEGPDGTFIVGELDESNSVAEVGGQHYATLQEAIDAVEREGQVVTLNRDTTENVKVSAGKTLILDLNGHNLTGKADSWALVAEGDLTIRDSKASAEGPVVSADYETVTYASGKIESASSGYAVQVQNGGNLVLESGTVIATKGNGINVLAQQTPNGEVVSSSLTVKGGYVNSEEYGLGAYGNKAVLNVSGGVIVADNNAVVAGNGTVNETTNAGGTEINLTGGTLIGHITSSGYIACGVYHPQSGKLTISGDVDIYADGGVGVLMRAGTAEITGGTITGTGTAAGWVGDNKNAIPCSGVVYDEAAKYPALASGDKASISGSAVIKATGACVDSVVVRTSDETKESRMEISGGTFSSDVSDYLAEGFSLIANSDGTFGVDRLNESNAAAVVNGTYYGTLAEAVGAAQDSQTVTVLKDLATAPVTTSAGITLDLDGHTLRIVSDTSGVAYGLQFTAGTGVVKNGTVIDMRGEGKNAQNVIALNVTHTAKVTTSSVEFQTYQPLTLASPYYNKVVEVSDGGTLTLDAGTVLRDLPNGDDNDETYGAIGVSIMGAGGESAPTTLTVNEGTRIETGSAAIMGNGTKHNTVININGGELTGTDGYAIYHPQSGELNITGGRLTGGETGIEIRAGKLNLSGDAVITAKGIPTTTTPNGSGTTTVGAGIAVTQHTTKLPLKVNISGGTISGYTALYQSNPEKNDDDALKKVELNVTGGTFVATNSGTLAVYSENKTSFISGGRFSFDPSDYVTEGKIAVAEDGMYGIQDKNTTAAEVVAGEPEVKAADGIGESVTQAVAKTEATGLTGEANGEANTNTVTVEAGTEALKKEDITVTDKNVTIVVQPYLDITVESYGTKEMKLDITPMVRTVATTADVDKNGTIILEGGEKNAVVMEDPKPMNVTTNVTLRVPLPSGFRTDNLYVEHAKDNGRTYLYKATVTESSGSNTATFTTRHGFSTFTLKAEVSPAAEIDGTYYETLQDAVDDVQDGQTIRLEKDVDSKVTVSREVTFSIDINGKKFDSDNITAGSGYSLSRDGNTFTVEEESHGGSSSSGSTRYTVSVEDTDNGSVKVSPTRASKGSTVTVTVKPDEGYELDELTVTDKNGDSVKLTDKGDGKYTFQMPASKVTVEAVFTAVEPEPEGLPFTDVTSGDWFYDAVAYVYDKGMMEGTTDTTFAPAMNLTRSMIAQVLYNLEERPEAPGAAGFPDVAAGAWYADAVNWAAARGIVKGYDTGAFGPEDSVTREQLAAILYRYAQAKGYDTTQGGMAVREFSDSASISDWAQEAMAWAVNAQVLSGKGNGVLDPQGTATRAEVAQMLMNFGEHVG